MRAMVPQATPETVYDIAYYSAPRCSQWRCLRLWGTPDCSALRREGHQESGAAGGRHEPVSQGHAHGEGRGA